MTTHLGGVTRRTFILAAASGGDVIVPVHQILDTKVAWDQGRLSWFRSKLWPEAAGDLKRGGIVLRTTAAPGEVERPPGREPVINGLRGGVLNFVITTHIPVQWDGGRGLSGVTALYRGHHLCMIALNRAYTHRAPFVAVNSCLHELLHALMQDIFEPRPAGFQGGLREFRVDWLATRLWLFGDGSAIRESASAYVKRLRAGN